MYDSRFTIVVPLTYSLVVRNRKGVEEKEILGEVGFVEGEKTESEEKNFTGIDPRDEEYRTWIR